MADRARRRRHEQSCAGKRGYPTRTEAFAALIAMVRDRGAVLADHQCYRCTACSTWHFGHKMRKGRPRG